MLSVPAADESALARHLLDRLGEAAALAGHPVWAMVLRHPGDRSELVVTDPDFEPAGWSAPPRCRALAMVATGQVRALDDSAELPADLVAAVPGGVRMACVVWRTGTVGWHMVLPDGSVFDETPESGRVLDVMLRCLDLPTPPPSEPPDVMVAYGWLASLLHGGPPDHLLGWSEVLDFHPVLAGCSPHLSAQMKETVIGFEPGSGSWEEVRLAVARGEAGDALVLPELADWMDEGMFARWILGAVRPLEDMLEELRPRLRPSAARRLAHVVRATG